MSREIFMNVHPNQVRVACLDDGVISELFIEKSNVEQIEGNIYKAKVLRVLPGMQAAFLDIGQERSAFLYRDDVVADPFENFDLEGEDEEVEGVEAGEGGAGAKEEGQPSQSPRERRGRRAPRRAPRESRPIEKLIREGQHIVVQVAKEAIGTKGARVTSHISLPGRYLVYLPTARHIGVSRRIPTYQERVHLRRFVSENRPKEGGFIIRTAAASATDEQLKRDIDYLYATWQEICRKQEKGRPPKLIYQDLNLVLRIVRDGLSEQVDRLIVDSKSEYDEVNQFLDQLAPDLKEIVELYQDRIPLFEFQGIDAELNRALKNKVWLKSGGYLIIDQTEALTAIDVNTGRFIGHNDFEETILQTNLEAADEIAYQLRLRNIGGIIILDFIDMERLENRDRVFRALKNALRADRVRTTINKISSLGLVEMTRKRTRETLSSALCEPCEHCEGSGAVKTPMTVVYEIFRDLESAYHHLTPETGPLRVTCHPHVARVFLNEERPGLERMEKTFNRRIEIHQDKGLHQEEFAIA